MIFSLPLSPVSDPSLSSIVTPRHARRGFTLVELLVVMAIIAIVIALVLPAIGNSRKSAQAADTRQLLANLSTAVSTFINDERRSPGYFPAREMGSAENANTAGMSEMENIMLDLNGYQPATTGNPNAIIVGPTAANTLTIDASLLGVPGQGSKQYFVPNKKYYYAMNAGTQQMAAAPHASSEGDTKQLPDLVDTFGTPILGWRQDDTYTTKPGAPTYTFARSDSGAGTQRAKFYWASNACFLKATASGKRGLDQTSASDGSLIGATGANTERSLAGAWGNPVDPYRDPANLATPPPYARSARAAVIFQSAGVDGYYFGRKDRGSKQFAGGFIDYRMNFAPDPAQAIGPTNQYTDKDGRPTSNNVLELYDDITTQSGN